MKRVLAAILVLILLCSATAFAAEDIFSGTILCPAVNGIQLGMSMPYVLLQEEYVNGNTPALVSTLGNTLDEVAANDEADRYITYTIGMIDVFGAHCELAYSFADNVLFHASCTASFDSEEEALKWCDDMTALFCNYYGDSYNDLSDDEFFEDMVEYRDWTLYTSELPYNVVCEKDGVELNLLPREYLRSEENITCTVEDGKYVVTATVANKYVYKTEQELCESNDFNEEGFTGDTTAAKTLDDLYAEYGDYADALLTAKYHDSRYYLD